MPRSVWVPILVAAVLGCAPKPTPYWVPNSVTVERVDYAGWDGLLREHVRDGAVDYPSISRDPRLAEFVDVLRRSRFTRETSREQRLAFLINGYNALVISSVVRGGSPASLAGRYRFFLRTAHGIAGESISLYDLENERIRRFDEPRIHFALVCASASCPDLRSEAYRPERLDAQLQDATEAFVNDRVRNRFDSHARTANVSKIFSWYEEDFTAAHGTLQAYLAQYVADREVASGLAAGGWRLRFLPYDWSLNGPRTPGAE